MTKLRIIKTAIWLLLLLVVMYDIMLIVFLYFIDVIFNIYTESIALDYLIVAFWILVLLIFSTIMLATIKKIRSLIDKKFIISVIVASILFIFLSLTLIKQSHS